VTGDRALRDTRASSAMLWRASMIRRKLRPAGVTVNQKREVELNVLLIRGRQ